jgi:hypothetical protein
MARNDRFWQPVTGDNHPAQVTVVDCDSWEEVVSESPLIEREQLMFYHVRHWRWSKGVIGRQGEIRGIVADRFWQTMDALLLPKTSTWLLMPLACRNLALLGFWAQLERGDCYVTGGNSWHPAGGKGTLPTVPQDTDPAGAQRSADVVRQVPQLQLEPHQPGTHEPKATRTVDNQHCQGCIVIEDPPTVIACKRAGRDGQLIIVDTANYGCDPSVWGTGSESRTSAIASWFQGFCQRLSGNVLGSIKATAGSVATNSLKRQPGQRLPYVHTFGKRLRLERAAYYGGRCEAYRIGRLRGKTYYLDVRSLYPSIMVNQPLPHSPGESIDVHNASLLLDTIASGRAIADVDIVTPHADYPVSAYTDVAVLPSPVPYWTGQDTGKGTRQVIYPVGSYRTCLAGPELMDALVHDRIRKVHSCVTYQCSAWLADWCGKWLKLLQAARDDDDLPMQQAAKRILVALVGKFGESGRSWQTVAPDLQHGPYRQWQQVEADGSTTKYRNVAWVTQREVVRQESDWSVPYVAAFITSFGRVRLLRLLRLAGRENVAYCDTDSLVCNHEAYTRLKQVDEVRDGELGYLRLLGVHERCEVWGIKHYSLDGRVKCAGMPRGSVSAGPNDNSYWFREHVGSQVAHGTTPQADRSLHAFTRHSRYQHGVVGNDGMVTPWQLGGNES